jgi:ABC-type enterochelin transport system ATPase subunit
MHGDAEYYSSMLVAQLESQRIYFEERLSITEVDFATRLDRVTQEHQSESRRLATDLLDLDRRLHIQSKANREQRESFERRIAQLSDEKSRLLEELSAERALSRQGLQTTEMYLAMIKERDAEIVILKEQVQDLMLHFESQERLSQEMVGGTLLLAPNNTQASSKKPIRRKGPR